MAEESYPIYDYDPNKLPVRYQQAIGLMAASAAFTESVVEMAIAGCLGVDTEYGWAVTTHMSMPLRFSTLLSAAEITIDDLDALDELDELIKRLRDAFALRNTVLHNKWCRDPDTGRVFIERIDARTRVEAGLVPMAVDKIKREAVVVHQAGLALYTFLMDHNLLPAFPSGTRFRGHKSAAARKERRKSRGSS